MRRIRDDGDERGKLFNFQTCKDSGGLIIGPSNQCVIEGRVHFADQRTHIDLEVCDTYFDGCDTYGVRYGELGMTSSDQCLAERREPFCGKHDIKAMTAYGEISKIVNSTITLKTEGKSQDFRFDREDDIVGFSTGDYAFIQYGYSNLTGRKRTLGISRE